MNHSVLGSITISYQPIWNAVRQRSGIQLTVAPHTQGGIDAQHLIAALQELWPSGQEIQLLHITSATLLRDLLQHTQEHHFWLEIPDAWLDNPEYLDLLEKAQSHGLHLVWRGAPGSPMRAEFGSLFHQQLHELSTRQALQALRAALQQNQRHEPSAPRSPSIPSPVQEQVLYHGLASQALLEHALDQQQVHAVIGWPLEEILYGYRYRQIQPSKDQVVELVQAIDADESLERLEYLLGVGPLLTYRFLRYANSEQAGLRHEVTTLHQGLMAMGYGRLRSWLLEQMPHASTDNNLSPIRHAMVLRAHVMEHLVDAGIEDELRREVFLCGVFSQVDLLLGESLGTALHRLPLPGRISSAILANTGPYAAALQVAAAMEGGHPRLIHELCQGHGMHTDEVNRSVLRALGLTQARASSRQSA
ncbi:HDOD domain-containing protein [Curvibacter sp. CHRR-16]|uniref:HDOD domain-containing protein n=1 Tax=Curvibacter sp. CHRR-16 TaxID=2835872 RepID=UPI001BD9CB3F|nr:HDOD domain-containing protein [Curvibacter sp. CHRR-16]MBT0569556.1 HDOD domain-containing protein [Curvibacter sp. CHRR-16]